MAEGEGTLRTTDGSVYTGHFSRGREDGEGTLLTKDGTRFEGFFKQGKKTDLLWRWTATEMLSAKVLSRTDVCWRKRNDT